MYFSPNLIDTQNTWRLSAIGRHSPQLCESGKALSLREGDFNQNNVRLSPTLPGLVNPEN